MIHLTNVSYYNRLQNLKKLFHALEFMNIFTATLKNKQSSGCCRHFKGKETKAQMFHRNKLPWWTCPPTSFHSWFMAGSICSQFGIHDECHLYKTLGIETQKKMKLRDISLKELFCTETTLKWPWPFCLTIDWTSLAIISNKLKTMNRVLERVSELEFFFEFSFTKSVFQWFSANRQLSCLVCCWVIYFLLGLSQNFRVRISSVLLQVGTDW